MTFYLAILYVVPFIAFLGKIFARKQALRFNSDGSLKNEDRANFFFVFIVMLILVLLAGLRSSWNDTGAYIFEYGRMTSDFNDYVKNQLQLFQGDWAFTFINRFIKAYISKDSWVFLMFYSAVTVTITVSMLDKYSKDFDLAVFLFIATQFYWTQMGAIRQSFAGALLFAAFPLIEQKKFFKYALIVLVAAQFHNSAYMFLLIYFLCKIPAFSKYSVWFLVGGALLFISYPITGEFINELLGDSKYGDSYSSGISSSNDGTNPLRFVIELVPVVLALAAKDDIKANEKHVNVVFNMALLQVIFTAFSIKYWIFFRFIIYSQPFSIILLCWALKYFPSNSRWKDVIRILCFGLYSVYYYIFMKLSSSTYMSDILNISAYH